MLITPLEKLVSKYFPEEKFYKVSKVKILGLVTSKAGKVPYSFSIMFNFVPVNFLETDKRIYIDWRKYYALVATYMVLLTPLLFVILIHFLLVLAGRSPDIEVYITAFTLSLIVSILRIPSAFTLINITTISKDWIEEERKETDNRLIKVNIPLEDLFFYHFTYNISESRREKLSWVDKLITYKDPKKLLGTRVLGAMNLSTNFTLKFREA